MRKESMASPFPSLQNGQTPLHMAVRRGNIGVVTELLERGAKVDAQDNVSTYYLLYVYIYIIIYIYIYIYIYIIL